MSARPAAAQTSLKHTHELVCLAMEPGCTAVGSQSHVTLLDPRKKGPAQYIQNIQGNCVRLPKSSLSSLSTLACLVRHGISWQSCVSTALSPIGTRDITP